MANLVHGPPADTTGPKQMDLFTKYTESMTQAMTAMDKFQEVLAARAASQAPTEDLEGGSEFLDLLGVIVPHIAPYIGPYVGPLLEKYAGVQPNSNISGGQPPGSAPTQPGQVPGGFSMAQLLKEAANSGEKELKAKLVLAEGYLKASGSSLDQELEKNGISREDLKKAGQNISRVL